jgi:hypothetical protein
VYINNLYFNFKDDMYDFKVNVKAPIHWTNIDAHGA